MRVLAVVPSIFDTSPGQRFRIEQWEPELRRVGMQIQFAPFESPELHDLLYKPGHTIRKTQLILNGFRKRFAQLSEVPHYDAVYLFREAALLGPALFERRLSSTGVPFVFDFDDAIFVPYISPANGILSLLKMAGKTASICRRAAHVMVGNRFLEAYARKYNSNVTIVPTTIDTDRFVPVERLEKTGAIPVLGWTGSYSTLQHLATINEPLKRLARKFRFKLRVITSGTFSLEGVDIELIQWSSRTEAEDLHPIDIGLMPLPEDRWSRGKCGCKALQYMSLSIPAVCSPTGVNSEIVQNGENGFLAATEEEWEDRLSLLLRSPDLRRKIGAAGRMTVEEKFSKRVHVPRIYRIFESLTSA